MKNTLSEKDAVIKTNSKFIKSAVLELCRCENFTTWPELWHWTRNMAMKAKTDRTRTRV